MSNVAGLDYTKFLRDVTIGTEWLFRLQANPTKSLHYGPSQPQVRGKVIPLVTEEQQLTWLLDRAPRHGFDITKSEAAERSHATGNLDLRIIDNTELRFFKTEGAEPRRKVTLRRCVFEGKLVVTDELEFRKVLIGGLGRAKSYGFGLITLRR